MRPQFWPGVGWRWPDGSVVYQEQQMNANGVFPIGYGEHGRFPITQANRDRIRVSSATEGFWVMDNLGSLHVHPFQTEVAAVAFLDAVCKDFTNVDVSTLDI